MIKRIGVLTSGGDAPGMNAAIRAVTRTALGKGMEVIGFVGGYDGLIDRNTMVLDKRTVGGILQFGGTVLKTARSKRFMTDYGVDAAVETLDFYGIDALVVIGGDGSFRGAEELSRRGICVMGLPGTIDNDMGYTDYTIGFDTAVNTVIEAIGKIKDTAIAHNKITIIEVMGRHCGDIALYSGLTGGAEYIMLPELELDIDGLIEKINEGIERHKHHCLIIKAEGVPVTNAELSAIITERTGQEPREVVLGFLQRGGSPSARDRLIASKMGAYAVELIDKDTGSRAIGLQGREITAMDLTEAIGIKREADLELMGLMYDLA